MGYTTRFIGKLKLNKVLDKSTILEIKKLNEYNPYVKGKKDSNKPQSYCQWVVDADKKHLSWDGQEKFYHYVEWLDYIIKKILKPKHYVLSGELIAEGENIESDVSKIVIKNNKLTHAIFSKTEIAKYLGKQERNSKTEIGHVICKTRSNSRSLNNGFYISLYEFLFKGIFRTSFFQTLVLVKGKDHSMNLYKIAEDEPQNITIQRSLPLPFSKISEVIHYNSPLYKLILRSNKVYCICRCDYGQPRKELYLFEDDKVISKIRELAPFENQNFLFQQSNDFYLMYVLLMKLIGGLFIVYITFIAIGLIYFSITDLIKNFSINLLFLIGCVVLSYYFFVIKICFKLFYYVFPKVIFRTKTVSNRL